MAYEIFIGNIYENWVYEKQEGSWNKIVVKHIHWVRNDFYWPCLILTDCVKKSMNCRYPVTTFKICYNIDDSDIYKVKDELDQGSLIYSSRRNQFWYQFNCISKYKGNNYFTQDDSSYF